MIYERLVVDTSYETAARYLKIVKTLMAQPGSRKQFETYIQELRITHKAKRNFIKTIATI